MNWDYWQSEDKTRELYTAEIPRTNFVLKVGTLPEGHKGLEEEIAQGHKYIGGVFEKDAKKSILNGTYKTVEEAQRSLPRELIAILSQGIKIITEEAL